VGKPIIRVMHEGRIIQGGIHVVTEKVHSPSEIICCIAGGLIASNVGERAVVDGGTHSAV
jgi:hypothetical protein